MVGGEGRLHSLIHILAGARSEETFADGWTESAGNFGNRSAEGCIRNMTSSLSVVFFIRFGSFLSTDSWPFS